MQTISYLLPFFLGSLYSASRQSRKVARLFDGFVIKYCFGWFFEQFF